MKKIGAFKKWGLSLFLFYIVVIFVLTIGYIAAQVAMKPPRDPIRETPSNLGLSYKKIFLQTSDGIVLSCWFIPNKKSKSVVILCHGYGTNKADCLLFVPFLHSAGYNLFLFDFRAHGESTGEYCTLGALEKNDLITAIRWVQEQKGLDSENINILGISMGGATSILVGAETTSLKKIVADSSFSTLVDILGHQLKYYYLPKFPFAFVSAGWTGLIAKSRHSGSAGLNPFICNPLKSISKISPGQILLIHGKDDEEIPVWHTLILYENARKPCELWIVPDSGHLESFSRQPQEYQKKILSLFRTDTHK